MLSWILIALAAVLALAAAGWVAGQLRWRASTRELHARIESGRVAIAALSYDPGELVGLPEPVRRFFRAVLVERQPVVALARLRHEGEINLGEAGEKWAPFDSRQRVVTRRPGFDWDARVRMLPGLTVFVHDAYVGGEGILRAALFGMFTLAAQRGTPELAQGELMRFLAEAAWYPTALLPSQGVRWEPIDDRSARATLTDANVSATLDFGFAADGTIDSVRAERRYRDVGGKPVATPWQGRFSNYEVHDGIRIPVEAEVAWILENEPRVYWRGRIVHIAYEFAR